MKKILATLLAACMVLSLASAALADAYPTGDITMVIPYGAGGSCDTIGRAFAAELEKELGVSIIVTNMAGATGSIGGEFVREAAPDGYTVLFCAESPGVWQTMGVSEYNFSAFAPISLVCNDPKVIVTSASGAYQTIEDLAAAIQEKPGKIKMAHSGAGSSGHIQGLMFAAAGYDVAMTPFDSSANALLAVLGGQVDYTNANLSTVLSYVESGDMKILASFSANRMEVLPDVPAVTEAIPALEEYVNIPLTPQSILVPLDTPAEVIETLKAATEKVFASDEWKQLVEAKKLEKVYDSFKTEEEVSGFYDKWTSVVSWLLYDAGASANSPETFGIARWN